MMLESSCNKITVVLGHAVVEWILILLLLLNSAFSYLIIKYAEFFGVELDHCFDQTKIVCEAHASHISKLGYCSNHRKLGLSQDMCHHCLLQSDEFSNKLSFRVIRNEKEMDFDTTMYSSYLLLESWYDDVLKDWSAACNDNDRNLEEESASVSMSADEMEDLEAGMDAKEDEEDVHTASSSEELAQMDTNNGRDDQEYVHSCKFTQDLPSTSSLILDETDDHGLVQLKKQMVEFQCLSSVQNESEEDEAPNTPASVDSLNQFLLKRSDIGSGESVTSELEGGEGVVTIESLKLALRAERKCSQALYNELEEERSASAEAVIQAMAMINRLHEEKAAMQLEAFQYQRMMEEQSEYDQHALQLMNGIIVKLDKEKQEMEKKLLHHEATEKMRVFMKSNAGSRSGVSSANCSINGEDSDGLLM